MSNINEEPLSDDEIFFGKLTLKEFKKHILWKPNEPKSPKTPNLKKVKPHDTSLKIIETHSEPDLRRHREIISEHNSESSSPHLDYTADDSFKTIENMVDKMDPAPRTSDNTELNNTLEVIEYILNHGPKQNNPEKEQQKETEDTDVIVIDDDCNTQSDSPLKTPCKSEQSLTPLKNLTPSLKSPIPGLVQTPEHINAPIIHISPCPNVPNLSNALIDITTPINLVTPKKPALLNSPANAITPLQLFKETDVNEDLITFDKTLSPNKKINTPEVVSNPFKSDSEGSLNYFTPMKAELRLDSDRFATPSSGSIKARTPVFKTPANPLSSKKASASSLKKTLGKSNAYQHITSPIASYIKNCPQVPLVKDVHPRKPLPGPSAIPKFVKSTVKVQNKENINLPSVAYKTAKKTKVINTDEEKLPQSPWSKKLTASLSKPMVMKHENREIKSMKKTLLNKHEDSFANLSSCQAEVSLCTQKTAFKSNNRN